VEIDQDQNRRAFGLCERLQRSNGRDRIGDFGAGLARNRQSLCQVPGRQLPGLLAAELADFRQRVFVLMGLNPQARKTGLNELLQVRSK
jgi:hypothetical protein